MACTTMTLEKTVRARPDECMLILSPRGGQQVNTKAAVEFRCKDVDGEKCALVDYTSLPDFLKHNEFVRNYYRSEWPLKQTLLSVFAIHNETVNVWTHLIGFMAFLALTLSAWRLNELARSISSSSAVVYWPFYAYMAGAMFCLLMSSACHLLCCHSEHTCYVVLRLDYAGITALIVTSFYPIVYYPFICYPITRTIYLSFITLFGLTAVFVSLLPVFQTPRFLPLRVGLFVCMALSGLVPISHKVIALGDNPDAVLTAGYEMAMFAFYGLGVLFYAAKLPERWMPGRFDIVGHSHQLFHLLVIAGAYTHYLAGLVYIRWRAMESCS